MAIIDHKLDPDTSFVGNQISELADKPTLTSTQMKAKFDAAMKLVLVPEYNDLIDDIVAQFALIDVSQWKAVGATCSYVSADSPAFVMNIAADVTTTIYPGYKIKITQDAATKYFIVLAVGSYAGGVTPVTVYGGTDYTLTGTAITNPYYAVKKSMPDDFPDNPAKWTITVTSTSARTATTAAYTSLTDNIPVFPGLWKIKAKLAIRIDSSVATAKAFYVALSSDAATETHDDLVARVVMQAPSAAANSNAVPCYMETDVTLATKTTFTLIGKISSTTATGTLEGNAIKTALKAVCNYL